MATYEVTVRQQYYVTKVVHNCRSKAEAIRKLREHSPRQDIEGVDANLGHVMWSTAEAVKIEDC